MRTIIKSKPMIRQEVVFRDGRKRMKIRLNLYVDDILGAYLKAQERLEAAENLFMVDGSETTSTEYGEAAVALMQAVFGDACAAAIIKFYEGKYIQMLADVYPFIQEKILPQLQDPFKQVRAER